MKRPLVHRANAQAFAIALGYASRRGSFSKEGYMASFNTYSDQYNYWRYRILQTFLAVYKKEPLSHRKCAARKTWFLQGPAIAKLG